MPRNDPAGSPLLRRWDEYLEDHGHAVGYVSVDSVAVRHTDDRKRHTSDPLTTAVLAMSVCASAMTWAFLAWTDHVLEVIDL